MHPVDCPQWEYDKHPDRFTSLNQAIRSVLVDLRTNSLDSLASTSDTRPIHKRFFNQLTSSEYSYFAGNYRGSDFRCLKHYEVFVCGDDRVGWPANIIDKEMYKLGKFLETAIMEIDRGMTTPDDIMSTADKIIHLVAISCRFFEILLRIHPYANGNGHIGRFCMCSLLGRYGFWINDWPIEPRPDNNNYIELIKMYRDGNKAPLELFILNRLVRN